MPRISPGNAVLLDDPSQIPSPAESDVYIKPVDVNAKELLGYYEELLAGKPINPLVFDAAPANRKDHP